MNAQELHFTIRLDDGSLAEARAADPNSAAALRKVVGDPASRTGLSIRAIEPADTAGHVLASDTVTVSIRLEDDLEGHTMTLRLPSPEEARRFQKRLLISGLLAASIVVGAAGAELATQQGRGAAVPGPAITVPAARSVSSGPSSPGTGADTSRHQAPHHTVLPE